MNGQPRWMYSRAPDCGVSSGKLLRKAPYWRPMAYEAFAKYSERSLEDIENGQLAEHYL
ncbi:Uncharacterised protein [Ectopseudomonas oleovorans]|uniref:Uncharacterized protein n=1 Tax=Ectopseudomonas oleovorans TaxID=301 RepID=A0A379K0J6_ECTOL|nr:Uncharacterised protein [Pseudomonas oleovorans]